MPTFDRYFTFLLKYMAFKIIIIVIELMFLGINMFLALLRAHFNPRYARAKMILSRAKNIFMPTNVNYCYISCIIISSAEDPGLWSETWCFHKITFEFDIHHANIQGTCYKVVLTTLMRTCCNKIATKLTTPGCDNMIIPSLYQSCWNNLVTRC